MEFNVNKFTDDQPRIAGMSLKPFVFIFFIVLVEFVFVFFAGLGFIIVPVATLAAGIWYLGKIKDRPYLYDELFTYLKISKGYSSDCFFDKKHFHGV